MAAELGKAYVQIVPSAQGISGSISSVLGPEATQAGKSAGINIAGGIGTALKGAATVVAAGTTAVAGALVKGSSAVASYGDNIDKMSQKMGLSAQSYQEWDAVMQHSGTSMESMKASMKTLANAAQTNSAAFDALGISQEQLASMSQEQLFEATISALQNVENETERTYLAGKVLGKGATELGALLNTSAEDTQKMRDRVRELGGVMSDEAVKSAAAFQDNMQDLQTALSGVGRNMMSELLPSMNEIIAGFTSLVIGEQGATEQLSAGFSSLFTSLDGIAKNIVTTITKIMPDIITGIAEILPQLIEMATTLIISLAEALVQAMPQLLTTVVPALAEAAVKIVLALGQALITAAPELVSAGVQLIEMLKNSFVSSDFLDKGMETVQGILDGITQNLPNLLAKGVDIITNIANGIMNNIPNLITTAGQIITQFASFVLQNLPTIMNAGVQLLLNLVNGIVNNLPKIVESVTKIIAQFVKTVVQNLPQILTQGITIIGKLVAGLIQAIPQIIAAMPQIINSIVNAFKEIDWPSVGRNLIEGIANGLSNAAGLIIDAAKGAAQSAFDAACDFLGINSPAKKGIWMGDMYDQGIALGITENMDDITKATDSMMDKAFSELQAPQANFNVSNTPKAKGQMTVNMTINAPEGMDVNALAEAVQQKLYHSVGQREAVYA